MDHWQYLMVLGACLLITAPLEIFGSGVYRQPRRLLLSVGPVAVVFLVWDGIAIAGHVWSYNPRYLTGVEVGFSIPLEELLFFLVIPICGLLTYSAVSAILGALRGRR
ncbi:lycopene cyclase domain-containing protein [Mycolicibacterium sp. Dal123E01]|uniref:lycopene cyclase domain-containing protein n=1 Tax=Mycolicibacterium sp. Dal123E01 TaxID=3457578 RepID=UPI00403E37F8